MKKRILVVGAGIAQKNSIIHAKNLGYEMYASDGSDKAPGLSEAHESRVLDVEDVEGNLTWAEKLNVDGVISYATDIALPTVLVIRKTLGLPGLGQTPMGLSLNKAKQRVCFQRAGIAQPEFDVAEKLQNAEKAAERIGYPLVIKPVDSSGSRGVTLLDNGEKLEQAYRNAIELSKVKLVILEKFEYGKELTLEGFSIGGKHHILAISDKFKPEDMPCVATQLSYPANISQEMERDVLELIQSAYDVVCVDNTPTHSEVILTENGPKLIEIGCRGGGFYVFDRVVKAVSGYDIVGNWTRFCAGDPIENISVKRKGVVLRFLIARPGKLKNITGLDKVKKIRNVDIGFFYEPGEEVPEFKNDGTRTGWMITYGKDREEAMNKADLVSNTVQFITESHEAVF